MPISVIHWNPRRPISTAAWARYLPVRRPIDNFGDLLGPVIVRELATREGLREPTADRRLLAVGSILRLAADGDTIWGIGANGKSLGGPYDFSTLDVRATRGPLTRDLLLGRGIDAPPVYGDPGLLVGRFWTRDELARRAPKRSRPVTIVPNFHDYPASHGGDGVVSPTGSLWEIIGAIAQSELVVGSSLHAIVVAESLGIPARLIRSSTEPDFKYRDYYEGTGRSDVAFAADAPSAIEMGGADGAEWDAQPLLDAFPRDLWGDGQRGPVDSEVRAR